MLAATKVNMSGSDKKSEQEHIRHFLRKTCNYEVSVVVQNNGKEIYKRCAARAKLFFFFCLLDLFLNIYFAVFVPVTA